MNFYELFEDTLDNLKDKQVIEKKAIAALDVFMNEVQATNLLKKWRTIYVDISFSKLS